ncbi:nuclear transport factor 2 family protein [Tomitella biformata]|uniref:nuclear transport factor 2 family protein n=1 Tax=Tomitella biformata TaxID=630403 RepID=UPI00057097B6|nr:nuclear transport factor 2 family protein [Tomitella biformata]
MSARVNALLAKLALFADTGTVEEYLSQSTADAVWDFPANPTSGAPASLLTGHAEIAASVGARRASGIQGPGTNSQHVITNVAVDLISADTARARSSWMFLRQTLTAPAVSGAGHYDDELRRVDGVWLLARRTVSFG